MFSDSFNGNINSFDELDLIKLFVMTGVLLLSAIQLWLKKSSQDIRLFASFCNSLYSRLLQLLDSGINFGKKIGLFSIFLASS